MTILAEATNIDYWPLFILLVGVAWVVFGITKLRLHPFLTLITAAVLVGLMTGPLPELTNENKGLFHSRVELNDISGEPSNDMIKAVKWSLLGFGNTAASVGLVVALAAIIGTCMMASGAADRVVRSLMKVFGEERAGLVLLLSGFLLSIPVFFDTVFFLLIPLARALALRTGKNYTFYVIAMAGAGAITHSMVPPTPGPLLIVDGLKATELDMGHAMMGGLVASILPAILVLKMSAWFETKYKIPMRDVSGASSKELKTIVEKKDEDLPPLLLSALPIALPVIAISAVSVLKLLMKDAEKGTALASDEFLSFFEYLAFFGDANVAMALAAGIAIFTLSKQITEKKEEGTLSKKLSKALEAPLGTAGVIILITGAGGAFGGMIRLAGVGDVIEGMAEEFNISYVLLAWLATAIIRIAQGSATVAMITGVGLMSAVIENAHLPYHPVYIFLAIGFGSITLSWMNDSGFWVVQRLSGFTEKETLKTWSVLLTAIAVLGLVISLAGSMILPLK